MQADIPDLKSMPSIRSMRMYQTYQTMKMAAQPFNFAAAMARQYYDLPLVRATMPGFADNMRGGLALAEFLSKDFKEPGFNLGEEEVVKGLSTPFWDLVHFKQPNIDHSKPKILLVAPLSGHFATLLRDTVRVLMETRDVYVTKWKDAAQVPVTAGDFDTDDYTNALKRMIRYFDGHVHAKAVCQPSVQLAMAVADMGAKRDPRVPISCTFSGGPIDTRINKTMVNHLAEKNGAEAFKNLIDVVPLGLPGAGREVYPGFMQLQAFVAMNPTRHTQALVKYANAVASDDTKTADKIKNFYDEYFSVLDMTAEFYLRTIKDVFVEHRLPKGEMWHIDENGMRAKINLKAFTTAVMSVEGGKDDITGVGQNSAILDLTGAPMMKKRGVVQPDVGHYGIFSGSTWNVIARAEEAFRQDMEQPTARNAQVGRLVPA